MAIDYDFWALGLDEPWQDECGCNEPDCRVCFPPEPEPPEEEH